MAILESLGNRFGNILREREKQARLSVHAYLASLDDASLTRVGIKRSELKTGGRINPFM